MDVCHDVTYFWLFVEFFATLSPAKGAKYCDDRVCMSVCLAVCLLAYLKQVAQLSQRDRATP